MNSDQEVHLALCVMQIHPAASGTVRTYVVWKTDGVVPKHMVHAGVRLWNVRICHGTRVHGLRGDGPAQAPSQKGQHHGGVWLGLKILTLK